MLRAALDEGAGAARVEAPGVAAGSSTTGATPAPPLASIRIVIHFGSDEAGQAARGVGNALLEAINQSPEFRRVPFQIGSTNVRYFFASDRSDAELVDKVVQARMGGPSAAGGPRDFTHYRPLPSKGTIEVWLAD